MQLLYIMEYQCLLCIVAILSIISHTTEAIPTAAGNKPFRSKKSPAETISQYETFNPVVSYGNQLSHQGHPKEINVIVNSEKGTYQLNLKLNEQLLAPTFASGYHKNGQLHEVTHDNCFYHGTVEGREDWNAVFSTCYGLRGWFGSLHDTSNLYHIEPIEDTSSLTDPHALYMDSEHRIGKETHKTCGTTGAVVDHDHILDNLLINEVDGVSKDLHILSKRQTNRPIVELFIVNDFFQYMNHGSDITAVTQRAIELANQADLLYDQLDINIVLVYSLTWTDRQQISFNSDPNALLDLFQEYHTDETIFQDIVHDTAMLLTGIDLDGTVIGLAFLNRMCNFDNSLSLVQDTMSAASIDGATAAHELGHLFSMEHDDNTTCMCPDAVNGCIMNAVLRASSIPTMFSQCSIDELASGFSMGRSACLNNHPATLVGDPVCGNGVREPGEVCDCGSVEDCMDPCCNASTCTLSEGSECASGECCDSNCQLRPYGTVCREAREECDIQEYCTGDDSDCPRDVYHQNGLPCSNNAGLCFDGECPTIAAQCELYYGNQSTPGDQACYDNNNVVGDRTGHCGVRNSSFVGCEIENVNCGLRQCEGVFEPILENIMFTGALLISRRSVSTEGGFQVLCNTFTTLATADVVSPGLVDDGTKCGDNKLCVSQECVDVSSLGLTPCPVGSNGEVCSGNGVCNNLDECSCNIGFNGTDCNDTITNDTSVSPSSSSMSPSPLASTTPSLSVSLPMSPSPLESTTPSLSATPSPLESTTPSLSVSSPMSPSPLESTTPSLSVSTPISPSPLVSTTPSLSVSSPMSPSPLESTTPPLSVSPSPLESTTPSLSASPSPLESTTPSLSASPSPLESTTPSLSVSLPMSPSPLESTTPPLSVSPSPLESTTPSLSVSSPMSPSPLESTTPSLSASPSPLVSTTPSLFVSLPMSPSPLESTTLSLSASPSPLVSTTPSLSVSSPMSPSPLASTTLFPISPSPSSSMSSPSSLSPMISSSGSSTAIFPTPTNILTPNLPPPSQGSQQIANGGSVLFTSSNLQILPVPSDSINLLNPLWCQSNNTDDTVSWITPNGDTLTLANNGETLGGITVIAVTEPAIEGTALGIYNISSTIPDGIYTCLVNDQPLYILIGSDNSIATTVSQDCRVLDRSSSIIVSASLSGAQVFGFTCSPMETHVSLAPTSFMSPIMYEVNVTFDLVTDGTSHQTYMCNQGLTSAFSCTVLANPTNLIATRDSSDLSRVTFTWDTPPSLPSLAGYRLTITSLDGSIVRSFIISSPGTNTLTVDDLDDGQSFTATISSIGTSPSAVGAPIVSQNTSTTDVTQVNRQCEPGRRYEIELCLKRRLNYTEDADDCDCSIPGFSDAVYDSFIHSDCIDQMECPSPVVRHEKCDCKVKGRKRKPGCRLGDNRQIEVCLEGSLFCGSCDLSVPVMGGGRGRTNGGRGRGKKNRGKGKGRGKRAKGKTGKGAKKKSKSDLFTSSCPSDIAINGVNYTRDELKINRRGGHYCGMVPVKSTDTCVCPDSCP